MSMTKLVLIEKDNTYSFFIGKNKIVKINSDIPLTLEEIEDYRKDPISLKMVLLSEDDVE